MRSKKSKNTSSSKTSAVQLSNIVLKHFAANPQKKFNVKQLIEKLRLSSPRETINFTLSALVERGLIISSKEDRYQWNKANSMEASSTASPKKTVVGKIDIIRSGAAYVIIDNEDQDVYIHSKNINGAMNNDIVKIEVSLVRGKRKPEGKVISVVKRALTHTIGTLKIFNQYAIIFPEVANKFPEVLIKLKDLKDATDGQKVVAEITSWGTAITKAIWGRVTAVMQAQDENEIAMQSILLSNGFNLEFPESVLNEVMPMSGAITSYEEKVRRDFRPILTFTIDPATAKDFDDAISYVYDEKTKKSEIGVHIADVTHYIKENSALDKEALERSTSVYLVDRVLPMLPEKLSNDLCSLNPHEDKYTFSAVFTFDEKHKIVNRWFGKTIIHSDRRFTYEEAQERLETKEGDLADVLLKVNDIALKLRKDRFKNGSINFESEEIRFILDENNKPIGITIKERKEANMLVEDFMLLANKSVAEFITKKPAPEVPYIYRVHDTPDLDRLTDFALFAKELGFQMQLDTPAHIARSFNRLAVETEKNPLLKLLEPLAIRTMAKAVYTVENIGHYGLGFEYYTHFTSPIRRYSDVLSHRILFENLNDHTLRVDKEGLETKCKHISAMERKAMDAERESVKYKQTEYMMDKIGQEFEGTISGMIEKGFFVEVSESKAEGLIQFKALNETYVLAPNKLKAISRQSGHEISMGAKVKVRLVEVDISLRQLEFVLVGDLKE